jgi:hypothetical protein
MKIPKTFLFLFAAFVALGALHPAQARAQVSVNFFYDNLSPYGEWVDDPDYGYCWHPTNVDDSWAPYTDGYWAYTDSGWTWVSYEDYGGIVYHYGRWARIPGEGWVWVPGYTWAPAWVSWRSNDDYVGWAPLPPEARWRVGFGFGGSVDAQFNIGPGYYSFVRFGDFGTPALGPVIVDRSQNVTIISNTRNITNITVNNSTVYTGGPSYTALAARSKRPIPTLKLVRQGSAAVAGANGKFLARQQGNSLLVMAPHVTAPTGKAPAPAKVAKTLTGATVDHGWDGVKDPDQKAALESKIKSEGGSATPAKSVNPEDLKLVAAKIKTSPTPKPKGLTTETTPKVKTKKSLSDIENAPATEETGTPAPTPKVKTKKSKELESTTGEENDLGTPAPKIKKSKKAKTPSDEETDAVKHTPSGDSNLQPFMGGNDEKPKVDEDKPKYTDGAGGPEGSANGEEPKKKKKGKGEPTPPQE